MPSDQTHRLAQIGTTNNQIDLTLMQRILKCGPINDRDVMFAFQENYQIDPLIQDEAVNFTHRVKLGYQRCATVQCVLNSFIRIFFFF